MTDINDMDDTNRTTSSSRRHFLAAAGVGTAAGLAGCFGLFGGDGGGTPTAIGTPSWYGSGPGSFEERPVPGGTSMADMPDLSGELIIYSGRGEALVGDLLTYIEDRYSDLTLDTSYGTASTLANQIVTEGDSTPADVFYSVNAGSLGFLADEGMTTSLNESTYSQVGSEFRSSDDQWVGTSGRARTIPYNTDTLSASDVPGNVQDFTGLTEYEGEIGWAPTYSSFQGFITAMRVLNDDQTAKDWLNGMQELNVQEYADEFQIAQAVADGELAMGFANHYYSLQVLDGRSDAPLDIAFTNGDAGSVFNVAGAAPISATDSGTLADDFVRHLLSSEAQEYFAVNTYEYPLIDGVDPVGQLPPVSELDVPDIDLSKLSNLDETTTLMREAGVL